MENNQKELILLKDLGVMPITLNSVHKKRFGLYRCYCGKEFKTVISSVKSGNTTSCGCRTIEMLNYRNKVLLSKHNLYNHPIYQVWVNMVKRCTNKDYKQYKDYGGRGITICDEWLNPQNFINDMYPSYTEGLTIDRKDNDLGYSKDNCRWITMTIQARNKRVLISTNTSGYKGVSFNKNLKKWFSYITVNNKRISLGYHSSAFEAGMIYDTYVLNNNLEHTRNFS